MVQQALNDLQCAEIEFNNDCNSLRNQFGKTRSLLWIDDVNKDQKQGVQSIDDLIAKCDAFSKKYL